MHKRIQHHAYSFKQALNGLSWAFYSQSHLQFHLFAGFVALFLGYYFQLSLLELAVLVLTIFSVIVLELVNTAIESIVDLVTSEWKDAAKVAKDVAAGSVLFASLGALIIGLLLFLPRFLLFFSLTY